MENKRQSKKSILESAQRLINSYYDLKKDQLMGSKEKLIISKPCLEEFKKEIGKEIEIKKMSDHDLCKLARTIVIQNIKKGLS